MNGIDDKLCNVALAFAKKNVKPCDDGTRLATAFIEGALWARKQELIKQLKQNDR